MRRAVGRAAFFGNQGKSKIRDGNIQSNSVFYMGKPLDFSG